ncbi:hypothetical protein CTA1_11320 [Colletotrichum tanaceti]|uniref:Uncharacterized protein n=1 Tax=Colletotrichum tanaceti TaxID=1306861 RepID=A0A4U6XDV6_9PEZI|nr:hypothetical protein CTA1_11320 [Colletotrichum tanaceti]
MRPAASNSKLGVGVASFPLTRRIYAAHDIKQPVVLQARHNNLDAQRRPEVQPPVNLALVPELAVPLVPAPQNPATATAAAAALALRPAELQVALLDVAHRHRRRGVVQQDPAAGHAHGVVAVDGRHGVRCHGADEGVELLPAAAVLVVLDPDPEHLALQPCALGLEPGEAREWLRLALFEARRRPRHQRFARRLDHLGHGDTPVGPHQLVHDGLRPGPRRGASQLDDLDAGGRREEVGHFVHHVGDGRVEGAVPVAAEDADDQLARGAGHDLAHEGVNVLDAPGDGTGDGLDRGAAQALDPGQRLAAVGHTAVGGLEAVDAVAHGRHADAAADVGADADHAAPHGDEGALAARGAAGSAQAVDRVHGAAEDVVDRVEAGEGLRHVGLGQDDAAQREEEVDQGRVPRGGLVAQVGQADGRVDAGDVEAVLDRHGQAVQGPEGHAVLAEVVVEVPRALQGGVEEGLRQAVCELVGDGGAVAKGLGHLDRRETARGDGLAQLRDRVRLGDGDLGRREEPAREVKDVLGPVLKPRRVFGEDVGRYVPLRRDATCSLGLLASGDAFPRFLLCSRRHDESR